MNSQIFKRLLTIVPLALFSMISSLSAEWNISLDFETEEDFNKAPTIQEDPQNPGQANWVTDPYGPSDNMVVELRGGNTINTSVVKKFYWDPVPPTDRVYTLYYRQAVEGNAEEHVTIGIFTDLTREQEDQEAADLAARRIIEWNWAGPWGRGWDWFDGLTGTFSGITGEYSGETWYEFWFVMDPLEWTCDLYVKGGSQYPEQTLVFDGISWREFTVDPITAFKPIQRTDIGGVFRGNLASYVDDFAVDPDGENLTSPIGSGENQMWVDWPIDGNGLVDTGTFMGWLFVSGDWVWSFSVSGWVYLPEGNVAANGAWAYLPR
jgi:hypothetical protein